MENGISVAIGLAGGLVCVALVTGFVLLAVSAAKNEKQRKDALIGWAHANGWSHLIRPVTNWPPRLPGRNRRGVTLSVTGVVNGHTVSVGEYQYTTTRHNSHGSTSRTTHYYVVVAVRLPRAYPPLAVTQRGALSQLGRSLFGEAKTATGNPGFDDRFRVVARDPRVVPAMVGPALISAHLAARVPTWSVAGDELLTAFPGRIREPSLIPGWAASLVVVAGLIGR